MFTSVLSIVVVTGLIAISCVIVTNAAGSKCDKTSVMQECNNIDDVGNITAMADCNDKRNANEFQCGIYLATSSIPNAGFGIYTTRSIAQNDLIQQYPETPSLVVVDFYEPYGNDEEDWNHVDYIWAPSGVASFEGDEVSESVMSFGSLCNYHPVG